MRYIFLILLFSCNTEDANLRDAKMRIHQAELQYSSDSLIIERQTQLKIEMYKAGIKQK